MSVVKNLMVRAGADFSGITKETKKGMQAIKGFQSNVNAAMSGIKTALISIGVGKLIKDSVASAMQVEASVQQIDRIMGQSSATFKKWANDQALAFNMSKSETLKYGAVYGNLISSFSESTKQTLNDTESLLKASAITARGTGRSTEDVMIRIRSGLLGNTEAIEDLGIYAQVGMIKSTAAFKKFANGKSWEQLSYQTQQQIRLYSILEQVSTKFGDSLNQNTNSAQQQFVAQLKNIQLSLGQAFLPIYQIILPALTKLAASLAYAMDIAAQFSQALFGKVKSQTTATNNQADAVVSVGDAYKETGKQAKKTLAGFDQLNTLQANIAENATGSADAMGTTTPGIANNESVSNPIPQNILDSVNTFKNILTKLKTELLSIGVYFKNAFSGGGTAAITALKGLFINLNDYLLLTFVPAFKTTFSNVKEILSGVVSSGIIAFQALGAAIMPIIQWITADGLRLFTDMYMGLQTIFMSIFEAAKTYFDLVWKDAIGPALVGAGKIVLDFLIILKGWWESYGLKIVSGIVAVFNNIKMLFIQLWTVTLKPIVENFLIMLSWLWEKYLKGLVAQVMDFVGKVVDGALEIYNKFIVPLASYLIDVLGPTFKTVFNFIANVVGTVVGVIADILKGLFKILGGIVDFVVGVLTGNWKKAWEGLKDIVVGVFDGVAGIVKGAINLIIDAINFMTSKVNNIKIKVPEFIPGIGGTELGFNIPTIPKLANGGLAYSETLAMIGDNPNAANDPEIVSPLSKLENMLVSVMKQNTNGSAPSTIIFKVGESEFARVAIKSINNLQRQTGVSLLTV